MIHIREMEASDIPLGLTLCRYAGWNQTDGDWRRILTLNPTGVFVAAYDGQPCGTISVMCYGTALAWIGMVLVHPDYRRRGIGNQLIRHGLNYARTAKVHSIKLDATDLGRQVYLKLGFEDESAIGRYRGPKPFRAYDGGFPPIAEPDWQDIARRDRAVFGADRLPLLRSFARDGEPAVVRTAEGVQGYGFARRGFNASFLGPLVADDSETARDLIEALLPRVPDGPVYWDMFPDNIPARKLADLFGFRIERRLTRMRHGARMPSEGVDRMYGAAGFEFG